MVSKESRTEVRVKKHRRLRNRFSRYCTETTFSSIQKQ